MRMLKKLKQIIKQLVIKPCTYFLIIKNNKFKKFTKKKCTKKIILLNMPTHGNIGDQAVAYAERKFIEKIFPEDIIFEFTHLECKLALERIAQNVNLQDIIVIPGGGFLGSLWLEEQEVFLNIADKFCYNKIVIFPHTIFFEDSSIGRFELEKMKVILKKCKNINIFAREHQTYKMLKKYLNYDNCHFYECPDIVTSINYPTDFYIESRVNEVKKEDTVLICIRADKEKCSDDSLIKIIINQINQDNIKLTDTYHIEYISLENRERKVKEKLDEFSRAKLVVTDRLHGMLFSLITLTPCIAFDNLSHKVSETYYKWLKEIPYVFFANQDNIYDIDVNLLLCNDRIHYDMNFYNIYYKQIEEVLVN